MLIAHGRLVTMGAPNQIIEDGALLVVGDTIAAIGPSAELLAAHPQEPLLDARGQWVLPGNICAHTHFYGAFARGMALPGEPPASFSQVLERLWWRLDKALQPEDIRYSALVCLVDAIRHGTTTLLDHHASPHCVDGSLDIIAEAVQEAGLRACLCYEVSDRDGPEIARAGLAENARFIRKARRQRSGGLAAAIGLHASFTLSEATLEQAAGLALSTGCAAHVHLAEDSVDVRRTVEAYGVRPPERLAAHGLLGPTTIAAHAVHVNEREIALLAERGVWVIHNPRSNMNNGVGAAPVEEMLSAGVRLGLGNDGFANDMFSEAAAAYLTHKAATRNPRAMPADRVFALAVNGNRALAGALFGQPLGALAAGACADVILLDYDPPTPVTPDNWPWHAIFGLHGGLVTTTVVGGKVLMRDRVVLGLDAAAIHARARELAQRLWQRAEDSAN